MGKDLLIYALVALVPLILGMIWYNPKVFGNAWMKSVGMTQDSMKGANMPMIFGVTYILSFFLCFALGFAVIHQFALFSLIADIKEGNPNFASAHKWLADSFSMYGDSFRTYKHGALHGVIVGITFALPVVGINALFERRGFTYIAINAGFWTLCCTVMGALICHFLVLMPM